MTKSSVLSADYQRKRLAATPPYISGDTLNEVYEFASECRAQGFDVEVDHIVPIRADDVCGLNVPWNLRVCLKSHNRAKGNRSTLTTLHEQQFPGTSAYTTMATQCAGQLIELLENEMEHSIDYAHSKADENVKGSKKKSADPNAMRYSQSMNVRERRALEAKHEINELIEACGMDRAERLLEVHRTTIQRWLTGRIKPPAAVLYTLRADIHGHLPGMTNKHWEGWRFGQDGLLYSPCGQRFHAGNLLSHQYLHALTNAQRQEIDRLRAHIQKLERNLDLLHTAANDRSA